MIKNTFLTVNKTIKHMAQVLIIFVFIAWTRIPHHHKSIHKKYVATYYAQKFDGRKTILGNTFSNNGFTVATTEKKYLGKWITLVYEKTGRVKRVLCDDLMNMRLKGRVTFDLTKKLMKYFSGKENNYPGKIELEIASVE